VTANLELLGPRHEVPAGMTGWWQINRRTDITPEQAVRIDVYYTDNRSLLFDLYILSKTVVEFLRRSRA
jgi:lipopolysaccharide/colanic/teichoic acid biosynthesis glycosyltransferase